MKKKTSLISTRRSSKLRIIIITSRWNIRSREETQIIKIRRKRLIKTATTKATLIALESYTYQKQTNMNNDALETPINHMHQQRKDIKKWFTNIVENQNKKDENLKVIPDNNTNQKEKISKWMDYQQHRCKPKNKK